MHRTIGSSKILKIYEQTHSGLYYIYPKLAVGTLVTSGALPWTFGLYSQIVPAALVTQSVYVTGLAVYGVAVNQDYIIEVAKGDAGSETYIGAVHHSVEAVPGSLPVVPSALKLFPAAIKISKNTRVSARCADNLGGATCRVRLMYKL